jgi:hypothetical protein
MKHLPKGQASFDAAEKYALPVRTPAAFLQLLNQ